MAILHVIDEFEFAQCHVKIGPVQQHGQHIFLARFSFLFVVLVTSYIPDSVCTYQTPCSIPPLFEAEDRRAVSIPPATPPHHLSSLQIHVL